MGKGEKAAKKAAKAKRAPKDRDVRDLPYRPCVGVMLLNRAGLVFVARRIDTRAEAWQMPQGGIDRGEGLQEAALRELREETGVERVAVLAESRDWYRYDLPVEIAAEIWGGRYRGQEQKWFAMRFLGEDGEIVIDQPDPEFEDWRWIEIDELPRLIVPFKRAVYAGLVEEFRPHARPTAG